MSALALGGTGVTKAARTGLSALLGRWLPLALVRPRAAQLPIAGLPHGIGELPPGEACLLLSAEDACREQLLRLLLCASASPPRVTWVCAPSRAPQALEPEIRTAARFGQLRAFAWASDAATQMRQLGPTQLLVELTQAGMHANDLLFLDAFDPWLGQTPEDGALEAFVEQATQCLLRIAKAHRGPLLALAPARHRGQCLLPLLAHASLPRLATLALEGPAARLQVVRWQSLRRAQPRREAVAYVLESLSDGRWRCRDSVALDADALLTAADATTTHALRAALHDASAVPAHWRVHASLDSLLSAAREAVAATVVLVHEAPDELPALADTVHRLRREHPRMLKIIVRETASTLRQHGELALLRLGANAVMGRELGFAHLVQLVHELCDQPYSGAQSLEPAPALQALAPDSIQGYLPLPAFCTAVERMLDRTAETALEHSLVHVPLMPHVAHLDALLACHTRRDGDLVTADTHGLVLFLFGCPPDDAMGALDSLFSLPCSELARLVQIEPDAISQRQALAGLRRAADQSPLDFSTMLRGVSPSRLPAPVQAAVLPTRSADAARCVHAHVLPLRAAPA